MNEQKLQNKQTFEYLKDITGLGLSELNTKLILRRVNMLVDLYKDIRNNEPLITTIQDRFFQEVKDEVFEILEILKEEFKDINKRINNSISARYLDNIDDLLKARSKYLLLIRALEECVL
ncbi:hypothetical protein GCM10008931_43860 [Oceanobacillus oncorhynchi subsp. oncorhynchi]|uniref:hypothetical protein n=1 Tax=Oceanobacillus oncorhynchi TaxID=545501 RepID=UPI0031CF4140